jgi:(2R)-3-sulfolactate dehydrogenase (NADP+)
MNQRVHLDRVLAACAGRLEAAGSSATVAASVARALVEAEAEGNAICGLYYLPVFLDQLAAGRVDGRAVPSLERTRPGVAWIDAREGFAQPALDLAVRHAADVARQTGIALVGIRNSYNALALGQPAGALARLGLVALVAANAPASLAVPGSARKVFGTNPFAFAAPVPGGPPLVIDQSASAVTKTEVMMRAARGEGLETGWAQDTEGRPTLDAKAALAGALLPAGGRKGANVALMVEVLAAALIGATLSADAEPLGAADRPHPQLGQTVIAIDPAALGGTQGLAALASSLHSDGQRLPGERRAAQRAMAEREGLDLRPEHRAILGLD